jgi:hypothetical protein
MLFRSLRLALVALFGTLALAGVAQAGGGSYVFDGGTPGQQRQVRLALNASAFDWSIVPGTVVIHIERGTQSRANRGEIWLDAKLLDWGRYSWGLVQHEYAHQVDFLVVTPEARAQLAAALGGSDWCWGTPGFDHADYGCERFASTLAWAYWPSRDNSLRPTASFQESAALPATEFRALLARLLGTPAAPQLEATGRPAAAPRRF